jgi:hypothetical protein
MIAFRAYRRFRVADASAIRASGLTQIGQFWSPRLRVAIARSWQRWQREEYFGAPGRAGGTSRC